MLALYRGGSKFVVSFYFNELLVMIIIQHLYQVCFHRTINLFFNRFRFSTSIKIKILIFFKFWYEQTRKRLPIYCFCLLNLSTKKRKLKQLKFEIKLQTLRKNWYHVIVYIFSWKLPFCLLKKQPWNVKLLLSNN